jgi:hypothetical protein
MKIAILSNRFTISNISNSWRDSAVLSAAYRGVRSQWRVGICRSHLVTARPR